MTHVLSFVTYLEAIQGDLFLKWNPFSYQRITTNEMCDVRNDPGAALFVFHQPRLPFK